MNPNEMRFMEKVSVAKNGDCWEWRASKHRQGYGQFRMDGSTQLAHRASWMIFKGEIPAGMCVCHSCDNTACVNPDHLWLGSQRDNVRDMDKKGRRVISRAENVGTAKLTAEQVKEIRQSLERSVVLAARYGVSRSAIRRIQSLRYWKSVDGSSANDEIEAKRSIFHRRGRTGTKSVKAKLTEKQAIEAKFSEVPQAVLAKRFGVARSTIGEIRRGKTWTHLQGLQIAN